MRTLPLLIEASNERHDPPALSVRMAGQITSITRQLQRAPDLSPRLQHLVQEPARLKWMDAEDLVDALRKVIDEDDEILQVELLSLTLTVARLGSILLAMRLGRLVVEEMLAEAEEG